MVAYQVPEAVRRVSIIHKYPVYIDYRLLTYQRQPCFNDPCIPTTFVERPTLSELCSKHIRGARLQLPVWDCGY